MLRFINLILPIFEHDGPPFQWSSKHSDEKVVLTYLRLH